MEVSVGDVSYASTEDDIRLVFDTFGTVERVNVVTERESGRSRGSCFVRMPNEDEARDAIAGLGVVEHLGRTWPSIKPAHASPGQTAATAKPRLSTR